MTQHNMGRKIGYWITTGIFAAVFTFIGVINLLATPDMIDRLASLGYPAYLSGILGVAKLLAVIAIVVPRFPRLKEWAYAGVTFDLIGASWSHAASGDSFTDIATPLLVLAVALTSWYLRPADRKLPDPKYA
jgi:uncharacterized membrane protein YphA (DoxX/SURF4 family)